MSVKHIILCIEFVFLTIQIAAAIATKKCPLRHRNMLKIINILAMIAVWLCFITIIALNFAA